MQGNTAVIGAYTAGSGSGTMVTTAPADLLHEAGAAYVFQRQASTWAQKSFLKPSGSVGLDHFGIALGLDGSTLVVGSPGKLSPPEGTGKAWTFQLK